MSEIVTKTIRDGFGAEINKRYAERDGTHTELVHVAGSNLRHAHTVTPANDTDLAGVDEYGPATAVYVGGAGNLVITIGEADVTFTELAAGMWHPMPPFTRVKESSTATGIIAGY